MIHKIFLYGCCLIPWLLQGVVAPSAVKNITYKESNEDFPNPERGFYHYSEVRASAFKLLELDNLKGLRSLQSVQSANYQVVSTLVFRYYILDDARDKPLSTAFLDNLAREFAVVRNSGVKLIPRFVYTTKQTAGSCPEGFICPPYGDAPKNIVLTHISQLKPLLKANADVIACIQSGFIGVWGEQYYSDFFGDASSNGKQGEKLKDSNWKDRLEILKALLDAVPADRMIQVRYPQMKQRLLGGVNAPVTTPALTGVTAFTEKDMARLGYHNDCFMASANDFGTYEDYGNDSSPRVGDSMVLKTLKDYVRADSRFVVVGGETCTDDYSPASDCEPAGRIQAELSAVHYSFINAHYNNKVNNDWQDGGCMDAIKRNLGYRFVLLDASIPDAAVRGSKLELNLHLRNNGYASPYNKRPAQLLLRNTKDGSVRTIVLKTDVRRWLTGEILVKENIVIPRDLAAGEYELLLNLPDAYASLAGKPEYSIRLANEDIWENATGYNKLNHTIKVN
ncbi:MAG: DUF4832 domain-containing protein [Chitinophagaceae bacterium]|nr:MAG: DUF4832 domain-containing protein [Chitinophagaceae bacterium]